MLRASRRRWFLLACTSLVSGSAACGQAVDGPEEKSTVGVAEQHVGAQQAFLNESSFAIYAANSISVGNQAHINGGRVGVRRTGQGPSLTPGYEIAIGAGAVVSTAQEVHADSMLLQSGATLGAIHANDVVDMGANHGPMFPLGSMPALPILPEAFPGANSLTVPANTVLSVQTDEQYLDVIVADNATLRLAGGLYQFRSLTLGKKSRLETQSPTVVRIAGRLLTGEKSFIGPTVNPQQTILNTRIEVAGSNGGVGGGYRFSSGGVVRRES